MTEVQFLVETIREKILLRPNKIFVEVLTILHRKFKRIGKYKVKYRAAGDLDRQQTERTPCKYFRCGSIDHLIAKHPKPQKTFCFNERGNRVLQR